MFSDNDIKIFDCVSFYNENELFDLRYELLKNCVDYFVVVEGKYDFNKKKKKFNFNFKKYPKNKIRYVKVENLPKNIDYKKYPDFLEDYYRQRMYDGLYGANPCDVVLFSCLDEIPHPDSIKKILKFNKYNRKIGICFQRMVAFKYNFQILTESRWFNLWPGTKFFRYHSIMGIRAMTWYSQPDLRNFLNYFKYNIIFDKGYHFSWMGGKKSIIQKYLAMSKVEERFKKEQNLKIKYFKKSELESLLTENLDTKNDVKFISEIYGSKITKIIPNLFYNNLFYKKLKRAKLI